MAGCGLLHDVIAARAVGELRLWLRFDDGVEGEVDLRAVIPRFQNLLAPLADRGKTKAKGPHARFGESAPPPGSPLGLRSEGVQDVARKGRAAAVATVTSRQ